FMRRFYDLRRHRVSQGFSPWYRWIHKEMATQAQIESNRRNSQKSTGPRTEAGKLSCSQNAFKSGIYAEAPLLPRHDPTTSPPPAVPPRPPPPPPTPPGDPPHNPPTTPGGPPPPSPPPNPRLGTRHTDSLHESRFYEGDPAYELVATYSGIEERLERLQR